MSGAPEEDRFGAHAGDYDEKLMRGLSLSGESAAYFADGRVAYLRAWWDRERRPEPLRIVDYGCGVGLGAAVLARHFPGARVLGLDPSQECVERAARRWAGRGIHFDRLLGLSPDHEPADLVHLNGVVHHVPVAERPQLFDDLAARLAPGGVVALFENNPLNPGTRWVMARIPFDRDAVPLYAREARRRLREARLVPASTAYLFYFPHVLRGLRPLERLLHGVPLGAQYLVLASAATGTSPAAAAGR